MQTFYSFIVLRPRVVEDGLCTPKNGVMWEMPGVFHDSLVFRMNTNSV